MQPQPSTSSFFNRGLRKSMSAETLSSTPARNAGDLEAQLPNVNFRRGTGGSKVPILTRPLSMQSLLYEATRREGSNGSRSNDSYTSVLTVTNDRLSALMYEVIVLLYVYLKVPNAPQTVQQYRALFVDQYLGICVATLSKAIEVNYGRKRDEMVAMILQVTKTLQCPIRISKLQLINPMSSSSIKICTLFLHWICCRVRALVTRPLVPEEGNSNIDRVQVLSMLFNHRSRSLESGGANQTDSLTYHSHSGAHLSIDTNNNSAVDVDVDVTITFVANEANNELTDENAALESRLETISKQNENKRKALAQLKTKRQEKQKHVTFPQAIESNQLRLRDLPGEIERKREIMQSSANGHSFEHQSQSENSEPRCTQERDPEDAYHEAQLARLEDLEAQHQSLMQKVYRLYGETQVRFLDFAFLKTPDLHLHQLTLGDFTSWLEAMEAMLSAANEEIDEEQRKEFRLKNAVTVNKLTDQFRMTPNDVLGIKSTLQERKEQLANEELKENEEMTALQIQLDSVSFQIHESSLENRSKEDTYHEKSILQVRNK